MFPDLRNENSLGLMRMLPNNQQSASSYLSLFCEPFHDSDHANEMKIDYVLSRYTSTFDKNLELVQENSTLFFLEGA
jgi:hypothetical protein